MIYGGIPVDSYAVQPAQYNYGNLNANTRSNSVVSTSVSGAYVGSLSSVWIELLTRLDLRQVCP